MSQQKYNKTVQVQVTIIPRHQARNYLWLSLDHCASIGGLPIDQISKFSKIGSLRTHFKLNLKLSISNFLTELKDLSKDSGRAEIPFADHS